MLSHANLRYQLDNLHFFLAPRPGDRSLSLLPPWHIYERSCGYFLYSRACTQVTRIPFFDAFELRCVFWSGQMCDGTPLAHATPVARTNVCSS